MKSNFLNQKFHHVSAVCVLYPPPSHVETDTISWVKEDVVFVKICHSKIVLCKVRGVRLFATALFDPVCFLLFRPLYKSAVQVRVVGLMLSRLRVASRYVSARFASEPSGYVTVVLVGGISLLYSGLRICIDLMRIRIRIRIQHFF